MFTKVCKISELQEGELSRFDIGELALLVVRFDGKIFVTSIEEAIRIRTGERGTDAI